MTHGRKAALTGLVCMFLIISGFSYGVADPNTSGRRPDTAKDSENHLHMVWQEKIDDTWGIYYANNRGPPGSKAMSPVKTNNDNPGVLRVSNPVYDSYGPKIRIASLDAIETLNVLWIEEQGDGSFQLRFARSVDSVEGRSWVGFDVTALTEETSAADVDLEEVLESIADLNFEAINNGVYCGVLTEDIICPTIRPVFLDLFVDEFELPGAFGFTGDTVSINFTVKNRGVATASGVKVELLDGHLVLYRTVIGYIDSHTVKEFSYEWTPTEPGTHYLRVRVDEADIFKEDEEGNNGGDGSYGVLCDGCDYDYDGLLDEEETDIFPTDPLISDTDQDGVPDYDEFAISFGTAFEAEEMRIGGYGHRFDNRVDLVETGTFVEQPFIALHSGPYVIDVMCKGWYNGYDPTTEPPASFDVIVDQGTPSETVYRSAGLADVWGVESFMAKLAAGIHIVRISAVEAENNEPPQHFPVLDWLSVRTRHIFEAENLRVYGSGHRYDNWIDLVYTESFIMEEFIAPHDGPYELDILARGYYNAYDHETNPAAAFDVIVDPGTSFEQTIASGDLLPVWDGHVFRFDLDAGLHTFKVMATESENNQPPQHYPSIDRVDIGPGTLFEAENLRIYGYGHKFDNRVDLVTTGSFIQQEFIAPHYASYAVGVNAKAWYNCYDPATEPLATFFVIIDPDTPSQQVRSSIGLPEEWDTYVFRFDLASGTHTLRVAAAEAENNQPPQHFPVIDNFVVVWLDSENGNDADGDMLSDYEEVVTYSTDLLRTDTDGDGLLDYDELQYWLSRTDGVTWSSDSDFDGQANLIDDDSDDDGLLDGYEIYRTFTDIIDFDTDDDLLGDFEELELWGSSPFSIDTDKDEIPDFIDKRIVTEDIPPSIELDPKSKELDFEIIEESSISEISIRTVGKWGTLISVWPYSFDVTILSAGDEKTTIHDLPDLGYKIELKLTRQDNSKYNLRVTVFYYCFFGLVKCAASGWEVEQYIVRIKDVNGNIAKIEFDINDYPRVMMSGAYPGYWFQPTFGVGYFPAHVYNDESSTHFYVYNEYNELLSAENDFLGSGSRVQTASLSEVFIPDGFYEKRIQEGASYERGRGYKYLEIKYDLPKEMVDHGIFNGNEVELDNGFLEITYYYEEKGLGITYIVDNDRVLQNVISFVEVYDPTGKKIIYDPDNPHLRKHKYPPPARRYENPITNKIIGEAIQNPAEIWEVYDGERTWDVYIREIDGHWYWIWTENGIVVTGYNPDYPNQENEKAHIDRKLLEPDPKTGKAPHKKYP